MPANTLVSQLDDKQLIAATRALYSYLDQQSQAVAGQTTTQLFDDDQLIYLTLALKKIPQQHSTNPHRIPITHSLFHGHDTEMCLITKDSSRDKTKRSHEDDNDNELKQYFLEHPVSGLTKVLSLHKLRREYNRFSDRRQLLAMYDLFLSDDRIIPVLPAVLGVKFFDKKKQPVPVNLRAKDRVKEVIRARDSTYMFIPSGPSLMVKIARTSFSRQQTEDNIRQALPYIIDRLPGKWKNIQTIHIKTHNSVALPIYHSLPLQEITIHRLVETDRQERQQQQQEQEDQPETHQQQKRTPENKRKRVLHDESELPPSFVLSPAGRTKTAHKAATSMSSNNVDSISSSTSKKQKLQDSDQAHVQTKTVITPLKQRVSVDRPATATTPLSRASPVKSAASASASKDKASTPPVSARTRQKKREQH